MLDAAIADILSTDVQELAPTRVNCMCGKLVDVLGNTKPYFSGIINYTDTMCQDCLGNTTNLCRIVCLDCKSLMGFVEPGKEFSGFAYEAGKTYHISKCPKCDDSLSCTLVLEHVHYCRVNGIPYEDKTGGVKREIEQQNSDKDKYAATEVAKFKDHTSDWH